MLPLLLLPKSDLEVNFGAEGMDILGAEGSDANMLFFLGAFGSPPFLRFLRSAMMLGGSSGAGRGARLGDD